MNPYESSPSRSDVPVRPQHFLAGFQRALVALLLSWTVCVVLVFVAKAIDWAIPGVGTLHYASIMGMLREDAFPLILIGMISFFSAFAYYAGQKQVNAGLCVILILLSGVVASWFVGWIGFESPRHLRRGEHRPIYLSEFLSNFVAYLATSGILTIVGNARAVPETKTNS